MSTMMTTFTTFWCSFFFSSIISYVAGGLTHVDVNRKPANLSEANDIICALNDKLSTCQQLLRENRWPMLVRGEIDRLFERYGSGITLSEDEVKEIKKIPEDSKKRKTGRAMLCNRMMTNLTNYAEIKKLKASIDEAHEKEEEITVASFCEVLAEMYECISENGAPYLRLKPDESVPRVMNMLTADHVNKHLNILMKNVNEPPVKEYVFKEKTTTAASNGTTAAAAGGVQQNQTTTVTVAQQSTSGTTATVGTTTTTTTPTTPTTPKTTTTEKDDFM